MIILLKVLHITVALFLILVVLLQTGKGAEMGAAFGGSSQTLFGGGGPASFMAKLTTVAAVGFMITSLVLAYTSSTSRVTAGSMPVTQIPIEGTAETPDQTQSGEPTLPATTTEDGDQGQ